MVYHHTSCDLRYDPGAAIWISSAPPAYGGSIASPSAAAVFIRFGTVIDVFCTASQARKLAADILDTLGRAVGTPCALCGGAGHFDDVECPRCGATGMAK